MYNLLLDKIIEKVNLTCAEQEIIQQYFVPKRLKKRQYLLQEGNVCDRLTFVSNGSLVSYSTDDKGCEHVISFAFDGCWAGDWASLYGKQPSSLTIEALQPCELLQIRAEHQELLFTLVPAYERFMRINHQNTCAAFQRRLESSLGLCADERYTRLIEESPVLAARIPLNLIASYLGVTPETLSRVRKQKYIPA
jgi:CRP-like cAMP-binding protein